MKHNNNRMSKLLSIFAVLMMVMVTLAIPMSSDDSEGASSTWTYTISISGNTSSTAVSISSVKDASGTATNPLTSSSVGSWGWDENSEYGPFGSYYAAFNSSGNIMYHVRADDLNTKVGSAKGTNDVDKTYNIMWVLPTVYWNVDSSGNLILSNDSSKGTAYAHTIDGKVYPYLAIGVYETYVDGSVAKSLSGKTPSNTMTRATFRGYSEYGIDTDADGTDNGYSMQWNYYQWSLYRYCVFTTLGTFDSQSFAGGPVSSSRQTTGSANTSGSSMPSGYYTNGSSDTSNSARLFLENAWGSEWEFIDNTYVYNGVWYVGQTHNASDNSTNKTNIATITSSGWQSVIKTSANNWGLPSAFSGSDSSGLYDYYWYSSGERSVFVGGSWGNGTVAGVSCVHAGDSLDTSNINIGSRLSFVFDADPASGYKVTFDANSGECDVTSAIVGKGKTLELPTPTRQYWVFTGWYKSSNTLVGMGGDIISITEDMDLQAHWTEQTVNLVFYYNLPSPTSGSNIYKTVAVKINTSPASLMPDDPTQYGLNFAGWYNETGCTSVFDSTFVMTTDDEVYAKWTNTLKILSVPTIACITHNTYSMSVDLKDGQTAIWFDSADKQIGEGAKIEYTFTEGGAHTGYVKIYDANGASYGDVEWSVDVDETKNSGVTVTSVIAIILIIAAIGYFALRRL